MGSTPETKAQLLKQLEIAQQNLASSQSALAAQKASLASFKEREHDHKSNIYKSTVAHRLEVIAAHQRSVNERKARVSVLKEKIRSAK